MTTRCLSDDRSVASSDTFAAGSGANAPRFPIANLAQDRACTKVALLNVDQTADTSAERGEKSVTRLAVVLAFLRN